MDVILDANAYLRVILSRGRKAFGTNQFTELLIYLRRTNSALVIPELTFDEVRARYRDCLSAKLDVIRREWSALEDLGAVEQNEIFEPDIDAEVDAISRLLEEPGKGQRSIILRDYSGVDIKEIARRGIERRAPANSKGEELRDVILWLVTLEYAKTQKRSIGLITDDRGFKSEGGELDPALRNEAAAAGAQVEFYTSVGDFVKRNALQSEELDEIAVAAYITAEEIRGLSLEQLLAFNIHDEVLAAQVLQIDFAGAKRYRVSGDSFYVEAEYSGVAEIKTRQSAWAMNMVRANPQPGLPFTSFPLFESSSPKPEPNTAFNVFIAAPSPTPVAGLIGNLGFAAPTFKATTTERKYKCKFKLRLSIRASGVAGRDSTEVDDFFVGELSPI